MIFSALTLNLSDVRGIFKEVNFTDSVSIFKDILNDFNVTVEDFVFMIFDVFIRSKVEL